MSTLESPSKADAGLSVRRESGVLTLTLQRTAVDPSLAMTLASALQDAAEDESIRVLLLCGTAGGVRGEIASGLCGDLVRQLRALPQPVIARLHGAWRGSVLALVGACDIVYVAADAEFAFDDIRRGAVPSGPLAQSVSRVMTARAVSRHAFDGRPFDGAEAERNGLATLSFPASELAAQTDALVAGLLEKDALALRFTKQTLRHVAGMDWDAVLDYNAAKFAELKSLQAGRPSARAAAVESFLAGTSKPGLGS